MFRGLLLSIPVPMKRRVLIRSLRIITGLQGDHVGNYYLNTTGLFKPWTLQDDGSPSTNNFLLLQSHVIFLYKQEISILLLAKTVVSFYIHTHLYSPTQTALEV